jgi:DNA-binding MarR family transcriptional regulator
MQVVNPRQTIFYSIEKAIKTYRQFAQRCISNEGLDITIDQLLVLRAIQDYQGISQSQIGEMIFKDYASVTRMIDLLVKKDYLQREHHGQDRRRHALNITARGREVIDRLNPIVSEYRHIALQNVNENEVKLVRNILEKLIENCTNGQI